MNQLEKIKAQYAKLYPKLNWELINEAKTNYSPSSDVIYFEGDKFYPKRFIQVQNYSGYNENIVNKFGQYKLQIYLHPVLKIYGEDTADENPTISKYFNHYPTEIEIKKELQKKKSSWFDKMKNGGSIKGNGTFNSLGSAKELGVTTKIDGHDMIAKCDCGENFSYQNSKKNIVWKCPECKEIKQIAGN